MPWISTSFKSMIVDTLRYNKRVNGCQGMVFEHGHMNEHY